MSFGSHHIKFAPAPTSQHTNELQLGYEPTGFVGLQNYFEIRFLAEYFSRNIGYKSLLIVLAFMVCTDRVYVGDTV